MIQFHKKGALNQAQDTFNKLYSAGIYLTSTIFLVVEKSLDTSL